MSYSTAWLEDPSAIRGIFIEATRYNVLSTTEEQVYLSTVGYVTTDRSVSFDPIVAGDITLTESMSVDGGLSFSFGDITIYNNNGERDSWLDTSKYIWVNRPIQIYYGDPFWTTTNIASLKTEFLKVFDGLIADIDSKKRDTLNLLIRDKMEKLNSPITESKLGTYGTWAGGQPNEDTIKPLVFGEVFNIEPLLIDPSQLEYMVNDGAFERLIEVRDNGVPIYTDGTLTSGLDGGAPSLSTGKFKLAHPLAGQITASVQGVKREINLSDGSEIATYNNNIAKLITLIAMKYGKVGVTSLSSSEIDLTNFSSFASSNTQSVGIAIFDRDNLLDVCQRLANSIGAQLYFDREGKLKLLRLGSPVSPTVTITDSDIYHGTLSVSRRIPVVAATKVAYCKNWTVQEGLLTGIPDEHKKNFATEWYTKTYVNSGIKTTYKLFDDPEQKETMLLVGSEADTEANRLNTYFTTQRTIYKFTGKARLLDLKLGQSVTLVHNRFDLYNSGSGRSGQVYSVSPNWLAAENTIEVIV
jgi:hypothetical protein